MSQQQLQAPVQQGQLIPMTLPPAQMAPVQQSPMGTGYYSTGVMNPYNQVQQYATPGTNMAFSGPVMAQAPGHNPYQSLPMLPGYQPVYPQQTQAFYQASPRQEQGGRFDSDIDRPTGRAASGEPLASVAQIIASIGGGDPAIALARLNEAAVNQADELAKYEKFIPYFQQVEAEHQKMAELLSDPVQTAVYYSKLEFELGTTEKGLQWIKDFRTQYPQATFEQFEEWKRGMITKTVQQEQPTQFQQFTQGAVPPRDQQGYIVDDRVEDRSFPPMSNMQMPSPYQQGGNGVDIAGLYRQSPHVAYKALDNQHVGQLLFGE